MKRTLFRCLSATVLALACAAWAPAQEDNPKPKRSPAKVAQDAKAKAAREQKAKDRAKADAEARAKAIDVNHATKDELKLLPGVTDAYAAAIIAKRPYKVKADLVLKGAIPFPLYQNLRRKVKLAAK